MTDRRLLAAALVLLLTPSTLPAVTPILWTVETLDEFEKGRPEGVAVGATGELSLSPGLTIVNVPALEQSSEPFLWSLAVDGKGTLYAGGGKSGSIYRVPRSAAGSVYYETGDLAVRALAVDRSDTLFAGTMPEGKIVRITGEGKGEVYYQPEDRYIWALAVGPKGDLYAATGERGIVYRISGPGKAETFFDSEEFHIVALAFDPQGDLIAGSDGKGLVYRITPSGKASVLYDSSLREISAIAVDPRGTIYAAGIGVDDEPPVPLLQQQPTAPPPGREQAPAGLPGQPPVTLPGIEEGQAAPSVTVTAVSAVVTPQGPPPRSEVYRIDPDGTVVTLWSSPTEVVYSLVLDAAGRPILGTGEPARIRALTGLQQSTLLAKLPESQVTSLALGGSRVYAASSNVGRLHVLDPAQGDSGTYQSASRDAHSTARWGRISWRAKVPQGSKVEVSTRTGNSATADGTWSEWSAPYAAADGSPITSPPGRFLQWRARLSRQAGGDGPTLSAVAVAYVQSNLPPRVLRLTLQPPGVIRERPQGAPETEPVDLAFTGIRVLDERDPAAAGPGIPQKRIFVRGMRSFDWEAEDPNGDPLQFDLWFRGESEASWKPLARGLREPYFALDSMQLPDGLYRVRLDASDAPANPADKAKTASLTSDAFPIDNSPPQVQVTARKGPKAGSQAIEVTATDGIGPIGRADSSLDGSRWSLLQPSDGISDSRSETYVLTLDGLKPGEHTVIVRVTDLLGNVGAGKATFTIE